MCEICLFRCLYLHRILIIRVTCFDTWSLSNLLGLEFIPKRVMKSVKVLFRDIRKSVRATNI